MRYNLDHQNESDAAFTYLTKLVGSHSQVEIKKLSPKRSLPQNNFFHLLVGYYGVQVGYFPDEAKTIVKRAMPDVFVYEKNGEKFMRSSADLTTDEMRMVIDRFYVLAGDQGIELPLVDNPDIRNMMHNEIEQNNLRG